MNINKLLIKTTVGAEQSSDPVANKKNKITLTDEQLDALALAFLPAMTEFFESDKGKKLFEEYQNNKKHETRKTA